MSKIKKFYDYLKKDTWDSWLVSLLLAIIFIKLIFFPTLSFLTNTSLPLVVVESCSMYHSNNFKDWWLEESNKFWYEKNNITKEEFQEYPLKNGLNKGDIVFVLGKKEYKKGDIIIFESETKYPLIHRIVSKNPISTKGDNNPDQLPNNLENNIEKEKIFGKAVAKIPYLGWIKLIFFEFRKPQSQRGFC